MLTCYRFFKELRNCDMHRGGIADQRLMDAYTLFTTVSTPAGLGVAEVPAHIVPVLDAPARISLRGVVGFTGMLFKIIATLDAELSRSKLAEKPFIEKWKAANPHKRMLSSVQKKRAKQIKKLANNARFPEPSDAHKFGDWLNQLGLSQF